MARGSSGTEAPWWLVSASETCSVCGQGYALEMERRCSHCDAPLCSFCATVVEAVEIVCSGCGSGCEE